MAHTSGKSWLWAALLVVIGMACVMVQAVIIADPGLCPGSGPDDCVTNIFCVGVDCSPHAYDAWVCVDAGTAINPGHITGGATCVAVGGTVQFGVEGISDSDRYQKQRCTPTCIGAGLCEGQAKCVNVGNPVLRPVNTSAFPIEYKCSQGAGSIDSSGVFTAGNVPGSYEIWAKISDGGEECGSEGAVETPHVQITVVKAALAFLPSNNSPDIGKKICTNAQDNYKKTKWKATVLPVGTTANVTTSPNVSASKSTVVNGDEFEVTGLPGVENTGSYQVKLTHSCASGAKAEDNDGVVFMFIETFNGLSRPQTNPTPDNEQGDFGNYASPPETPEDNFSGGKYTLNYYDTYQLYGLGDYDLDYNGAGKLTALIRSRNLPANIVLETSSRMADAKFEVGTIPQNIYTGNIETRYQVNYTANTEWAGSAVHDNQITLSFGYEIAELGIAIYTQESRAITQTAIAIKFGPNDKLENHSGANPVTIFGDPQSGSYSVPVAFTTQSLIGALSNGKATFPVSLECGVQVRRENTTAAFIYNNTAMGEITIVRQSGYWKIHE